MPSLAVSISHLSTLPLAPEASRRPSMTNSAQFTRRESQVVISDAPLTPPLSPSHTEQEVDSIIIDSEPRYSGPDRSIPHSEASAAAISARLDTVDMEVDRAPTSAPQPPLRLLEDEQVHLQRSGLKLSDFDVQGTLGSYELL